MALQVMDRPADTERKNNGMPRHWLLLGSLYSTQFLGLSFFVIALVAILRERGASLESLGLVYMLGLVWPLKLLWAPFIDRVALAKTGHYRNWLLLMQAIMVVLLLCIGLFDVVDDFAAVYILCVGVALASATQDIAVDGLACRLLGPSERGVGNGLQIAGGLVGNLIGGGVMLMVYPHIGWQGSMILLAAATSVSLVQLVFFREPRWEAGTETTASLFRRFGSFWRGNGYWFLLLALFPIGSGIAYAVMTPALVDAGWDLARIGFTVNVLGSLAGLAAALATGWAIGRFGRRKILIASGLLQIGSALVVMVPVLGHAGQFFTGIAVILFFVCYNPAYAVLATLMMDHASENSPATDYTLQYTLSQFVAIAMMMASATIAAQIGYLGVLMLGAASALAATLLSLRYRGPGIAGEQP